MSIWFFLWFILAFIILGASAWSTIILFKQKKAWQDFALRHKLKYTRGKVLAPASVEGQIGDYGFSLFTAERQDEDARKRRFMSVFELTAPSKFVDGGVVGTAEMLPFMQSLESLTSFPVPDESWVEGAYFFARNHDDVKAYFTPERLKHLCAILGTKNTDILLIFDGTERAVLRLETKDPLLDPDKLDKGVKRLMKHLDALC